MARRISLLTVGTLGDVEPMVALGLALKDEGYEVSLAVPEVNMTVAGAPEHRLGSQVRGITTRITEYAQPLAHEDAFAEIAN